MRILQINNCHYNRGGADVVYLNTGELLEKKGHEVYYFSQCSELNKKCKTESYFINSVDFFNRSFISRILLIFRFFYSFEAASKIEKLILDKEPEIAHIHYYKGGVTPSVLRVLHKHKIPVVQSLHDYGLLCPHNLFLDGRGHICTRCADTGQIINCIKYRCNRNNILLSTVSALEYKFHSVFIPFDRYFSGLIAVSKFGYDIHAKNKKFQKKLYHLYNFYPDIESIIPSVTKGKYFLFFGRLSTEKGVLTLIKAWERLGKEYILKIVGDGPMNTEIDEYISKNSLGNIHCLGFKSKSELEPLISNSSFIIVPSEWFENNPLTIIEAYANGKPVIGSNVGGISEIIVQDRTGFLFTMGDFIQLSEIIVKAATISDELYAIMSKNAFEFAKLNFSESGHYRKLMGIYNKVINTES